MNIPTGVGAQHLAQSVRRRAVSAREITEQALESLHLRQPDLNLTTYINEQALERAAELDVRIAAGEDPGPMCGVPVLLKDLIDQAGVPNTCGSAFYRPVPKKSAPAVRRLEQAGAVIVGRAGLHEFAFGFSSENQWSGPIRNPHDPSTSPGGSSGGSAAAVAAGVVPVSIGTDTGGSIRVPAAMCGIFGLKVTHGRVPLTGVFPLGPSLDTVGPFAANSEDLALTYVALAGRDPYDRRGRARTPAISPQIVPLRAEQFTIGLPDLWLADAPYAKGAQERFEGVMSRIESLGFRLEAFQDPVITPPGRINHLLYPQVAAVHRKWWEGGKPYGEEVAGRIRETLQIGGEDPARSLLEALAWQSHLKNRMTHAFDRFDLLAIPTSGALRKVIGDQQMETTRGRLLYRVVLSWFTSLVNTSGCPAISIPVPHTGQKSGVPFSLQLIAPWWKENRLLRAAATLEKAGIARSILATEQREVS